MSKKLFLAMAILTITTSLKAQFPPFTNFEGSRIYVDSSADTKKFRDVFSLGNRIDAFFADSIRARAITVSNHLVDSINRTRTNTSLTLSQRNDIISNLQDSISLLDDVRDYYSSINKFTGKPKQGASLFPVSKSNHARFFYQGANTDNKVDFLSNFVLQTNLDKSAISSD